MGTKIEFLAFKDRGELTVHSEKLRMGVKVPLDIEEIRALAVAMMLALDKWDGEKEV